MDQAAEEVVAAARPQVHRHPAAHPAVVQPEDLAIQATRRKCKSPLTLEASSVLTKPPALHPQPREDTAAEHTTAAAPRQHTDPAAAHPSA